VSLRQLKDPIVIKPARTLPERIQALGTDFASFAEELDEPTDRVAGIFPTDLVEDHIHVLVQLPSGECRWLVVPSNEQF
jgi:hypothetical protein